MHLTKFDKVLLWFLIVLVSMAVGAQIAHWENRGRGQMDTLIMGGARPTPKRPASAQTFLMSHYSQSKEEGTADGITATGTKVAAHRTIAVDPRVIPLGRWVHIRGEGLPSRGILRRAEDTGSAVKGNHIDLFVSSRQEALRLGVKRVQVKVMPEGWEPGDKR